MKYRSVRSATDDGGIRQACGAVGKRSIFKLGLNIPFRNAGDGRARDRVVAFRRNGDGALHPFEFLGSRAPSAIGEQATFVHHLHSETARKSQRQLIIARDLLCPCWPAR